VGAIARAYRNGRDQHEVAYVSAGFHDNLFAHIELSWLHPTKVREVVIIGSDGALTVDCLHQRVFHRNAAETIQIPVEANNTIASEIEHFVDAVARNDCASGSGLVGARTVETLEQIRASVFRHPVPFAISDVSRSRTVNLEDVRGKPLEAEIEIQATHLKETAALETDSSKNFENT
jgi:predicted dehydrogenase